MLIKKLKGNWSKYQLNTLLNIYCVDNQEIFETQYLLKSIVIVNIALHLSKSDKITIIN